MTHSQTLRAAVLLLVLPLAFAPAVRADAVRLAASDDRGVTLELAVPDDALSPANQDGRSSLTARGLTSHALPGRPVLPSATALIALPPGARAMVGGIEGGELTRDGVRLVLGDKRGFAQDPEGMGQVPTAEPAEPIVDGAWPVAAVELGAAFTLRGQRMVAVTLHPYRYDEGARRLWTRRSMRVRIDFAGTLLPGGTLAPATEDKHWEPVLKGALINYEQGRRWRVAPPRAVRGRSGPSGSLFDRLPGRSATPAGAADIATFDEDDPEVRVTIDTTGVYALPYSALAAKGYPPNVAVGEVSVHRHEFTENVIPAYQTIELPCEVEEAAPANGIFDGGDRIVVFVQSWAERSGATLPQRVWGDGEAVFVTRVPRLAARIGPRNGWLDAVGLTPLATYPWTQRWEKQLTYLTSPGTAPAETLYDQFHWTGILPYYDRNENIVFEANDIDLARDVQFTIAWQGRRAGALYYTWGQVRSGDGVYYPVADSVGWSGKDNLVVSATLPPGSVTEGETNAIVQWGRFATGPPNPSTNGFATVSLNWFEGTYWRSYQALANYLPCNSADAAGQFELFATGFADSNLLRAYDITDPGDPRRMTNVRRERDGTRFALRLQDDATAGRRKYIVFSQPKSVPASRFTAVTRANLASSGGGDYVIIAPEAWMTALDPLVAAREANGLRVIRSPLEAVFDEFNGGRRSAWAIKRYARFALNNWQAKFLVLVGDGTEDPKNYIGESGPDIIPIARVPGPVGVADGREIVPSDGWYVWCLNGCTAGDPIVPELFIGRLPTTTLQETQGVVAKLVAYDAIAPNQAWRNRELLLSDDEFSGVTTFGGGGAGTGYCQRFYEDRFRRLNDTIRGVIVDEAGLARSEVEHFDVGVWLANEPVDNSQPPCRPDLIATQNRTRATVTPALISRLNAGRMWWNYQGHANEYLLGHENFYRNVGGEDDKDLLTNDGMPFMFSAFSCHANAFARANERRDVVGPPLGEELVVMPSKGAIASYASVGYEIIPDNGTDHINVAWARAMFLDPPHDDAYGNGDLGARVVLGESIALALLRYIPTVVFDPTESGLALTYTLLGDPGTRISIGLPQSIVTANGDTVISDRPVSLAAPRDTLHLEAELVSNVVIRTITLIEGGSGGATRVIPDSNYVLTPSFPDTAASGLGGRRYHLSYTTPLRPGVTRYTIRTADRYGLQNDFNVVFPFFTQLRVSDNPLIENDVVAPTAELSLKLEVPTPLTDPQTQLTLAVDSVAVAFTATAMSLDGRSWILRWTHAPYPGGTHLVELTALSTLKGAHHFRVVDGFAGGERMLRDVMAFPNPFDDQLGSAFSYYLLTEGPADVMLRLFTVSGRLVYQRVERSVPPGYHQWPWDGRDAEGDRLANGVYVYRMVASNGSRSETYDGRLVKLRKPRRGSTTVP
ncbi:MAG TPA: C25 family cysteine peptidase [Candidatus Eisenbacteria bacterium]|nr:C25 family cysteine peptidase [Candidatus Eisenbacteria bacterium]